MAIVIIVDDSVVVRGENYELNLYGDETVQPKHMHYPPPKGLVIKFKKNTFNLELLYMVNIHNATVIELIIYSIQST